ncbi:MAG: hypothetical protein HKN37_01675, partial [Rhodothermales bacterium]|nr:hypothetical protein [Rhodothermales bacterium]
GNRKGYAGYEFEAALADAFRLYHVRHRVLNSDLGRWGRRDPLRYIDGANLLAYVMANPLAFQDSTGQLWITSAPLTTNKFMPCGGIRCYYRYISAILCLHPVVVQKVTFQSNCAKCGDDLVDESQAFYERIGDPSVWGDNYTRISLEDTRGSSSATRDVRLFCNLPPDAFTGWHEFGVVPVSTCGIEGTTSISPPWISGDEVAHD